MTFSSEKVAGCSRSKHKTYVFMVVIVAVASLAAYRSANFLYHVLHKDEPQRTEVDDPQLAIAENDLNLGRVYETSAYKHRVRITNPFDQPVTIVQFERSCDCLEISPGEGVTLQPHEAKTFAIILGFASRAGSVQWGEEPIHVNFHAVYSIGGRQKYPAEWRLNCILVPTIQFRPSTIHLGNLSDHQPLIEQDLDIEASDEVWNIDCEATPHWAVKIVPAQASSSPNKFHLFVQFQGKPVPCLISDVLRLTPVSREGKRLPAKELRLVGEIVRDIVACPREIHHGRQPHGTAATETIQLRSLTNQGFLIKGVSSSNSDLEVSRLMGEDKIYALRQRFTRIGPQEAVAEFTIQDEDGIEYRLAVPVRYHGMAGP